jgi:hypothetical protein
MKKLLIGMTVVALLGLLVVPAIADTSDGGDVTLTLAPYFKVEITDLPHIQVNSAHPEQYDSGIIGGYIGFKCWWNCTCHYHITCALNGGIATDHPEWNLYIPAMGEYNTFYVGGYPVPGTGLGSSIILDVGGSLWGLDASEWDGVVIGTVTMTMYDGVSPPSD